MKRLCFLFILINYYCFGQLSWGEVNTGVNAIISVGDFSIWEMSAPTLNGEDLPAGSLIGVFYTNDNDEYVCGGAEIWGGADAGMIAVTAWGAETGENNGFVDQEPFNFFARVPKPLNSTLSPFFKEYLISSKIILKNFSRSFL
mgnify:CR=1 FL=1